VGFTDVIIGSAKYSNTKSVATKCSLLTESDMSDRPGLSFNAGVTQLTWVAEWYAARTLRLGPKRQYMPFSSISEPYMCTTVPPDRGPKVGVIESISGTDTYFKNMSDALESTPFTETLTFTLPTACGGAWHTTVESFALTGVIIALSKTHMTALSELVGLSDKAISPPCLEMRVGVMLSTAGAE